jgi:hypothetical protein
VVRAAAVGVGVAPAVGAALAAAAGVRLAAAAGVRLAAAAGVRLAAAAEVAGAEVGAPARGVAVVLVRLAWPLGAGVGVATLVGAAAAPAAAAASAVGVFGSAPGAIDGVAVALGVVPFGATTGAGAGGGAVAIAAFGVPATVTAPSGATTRRAESCTGTIPSDAARWASAGAASIAVTSRRSCSLCSLSARAATRASWSR